MPVRIPWDQYEATLLLAYCIDVEEKKISRKEAVTAVSQKLRDRAVFRGYEIDDVFRNENGISMQMSSMRNCFLGNEKGLTISKLFRDVVKLYKENRVEFQRILQEEPTEMTTSNWQGFLSWLKENYSDKEQATISALSMVNIFARRSKLIDKSIRDIEEPEKIKMLKEAANNPRLMNLHSKKSARAACHALEIYIEYLNSKANRSRDKKSAPELIVNQGTDRDACVVDFNASVSYAHTKPISCTYKGNPVPGTGWNALFINVVRLIYQDCKETFPVGKSLSASTRIDIGPVENMINPKEIADGIYLECNVSATGIVNKLQSIMNYCGLDYDCLVIQYRRNDKSIASQKIATKKTETTEKQKRWAPSYSAQIEKLISNYYKYGFRMGSPIELIRFRNYAEAADLNLPASDEELEKEISAVGTVIDGKVFVLASSTVDYLKKQLAEIFESGYSVIFLEVFYDKNIDFMEENHIASPDMLKDILKRTCQEYYYGQNIITAGEKKTEVTAIMDDIYRLCEGDGIIVCSDIVEQLVYVPEEKILWTLSYCDGVVRIGEGKYFNLNHFIVNESDAAAIKEYVKTECDRNGYASISDIPMGNIPEENYELNQQALYSAIYTLLLKNEYSLNGKILTRENAQIDIVFLLKTFCQDLSECTVAEVTERMKELTGTTNKQYSMVALFDTMIRVDDEHFISEDQIEFDVETIDNLLSEYVGERFSPIRSIPTFALFPLCGTNWNYYLLESYCYRFSRKYHLSVINYNDKNAGIIVSRSLTMNYNDMLSEAAANADIELTEEAVGKYFFDLGYTARRKYASLPDIIAKAIIIREES